MMSVYLCYFGWLLHFTHELPQKTT